MSALRDAIDFTTLGWIKPELDETLRQARMEIEAFAEDPSDASRMRFCSSYLHQVQGTLRMVELYAPAMVAEEMEQLAQALQDGSVPNHDEACATLMRGVVLLPDYLERLQGGVLERLQPLFDALDAGAVEAHFPGLHQIVQHPEHFGHVVHVGRWAVKLDQVERRDLEILEAALHVPSQVYAVVAFPDMRTRAASDLGGHPERIASLAPQPGEQSFAVTVAIDVSGIEEIDAEVQRAVQAAHCLSIIHLTPGATDGPGTETDRGHGHAGPSKRLVVH